MPKQMLLVAGHVSKTNIIYVLDICCSNKQNSTSPEEPKPVLLTHWSFSSQD